jgi:spore germination cell wall hydrolase CwlJ-like protein
MDELVGHQCTKYDTDPITCLACNTIFEARIDKSFAGKLLPPRSVMVRYNTAGQPYGKSVCGIVHFRAKGTCAYSWSCESPKKINGYHRVLSSDGDSVLAALIAYYEVKVPYSFDSYWNNALVHPGWAYTCKNVERIGLHTACRIIKPIDGQAAGEQAMLRDHDDHIDWESISKFVTRDGG